MKGAETMLDHITNNTPSWPLAVLGTTSWAWLPSLASVNDLLTMVLTGAGIVLSGLKIYDWFKKRNDREDNP